MSLFAPYAELKQFLSDVTGASEDLLHVHFGLLIFVLFALLLRRRMRSPWPLTAVFVFAVGNEVIDYFNHEDWALAPNLMDILNTVFWPVVLFGLARRGGGVSTRVEPAGEAEPA
jgi:hypothetical protein